MRWAIIRDGGLLYAGSREECLRAAERHRLICHVLPGERDPILGRGFTDDGTEYAPRLRDAVMMPEAMLPARLRRRAA